MARKPFPHALEMRRMKYDPSVPPEARDRLAEELRAVGRRAEAILLHEGRPDSPVLTQDLQWAISEGASFYVTSLRRTGVPVSDEQIRACAEAAERKERWFDAHRCYGLLKDAAALERVATHLPGYKPAIPANKAETP